LGDLVLITHNESYYLSASYEINKMPWYLCFREGNFYIQIAQRGENELKVFLFCNFFLHHFHFNCVI